MSANLSSSSTAHEDFGILLGLAYLRFVDALNADLRQRGFTNIGASFGYVLRAVANEPLTTTQLGARLQLTPQGAAKIVDDMVQHGYLERREDPSDGRAKLLFLASRGRRALRAARAFHRAFEEDFARIHGAPLARTLREALELLTNADASGAANDTAARLLRPI
jgi:DNA-binding MarR family transcriptional regulator